jgi:hypothetical protein
MAKITNGELDSREPARMSDKNNHAVVSKGTSPLLLKVYLFYICSHETKCVF